MPRAADAVLTECRDEKEASGIGDAQGNFKAMQGQAHCPEVAPHTPRNGMTREWTES